MEDDYYADGREMEFSDLRERSARAQKMMREQGVSGVMERMRAGTFREGGSLRAQVFAEVARKRLASEQGRSVAFLEDFPAE